MGGKAVVSRTTVAGVNPVREVVVAMGKTAVAGPGSGTVGRISMTSGDAGVAVMVRLVVMI